MKRRIPDLDPPLRRRRHLTPEEEQIWEAEVQGKAKLLPVSYKEKRTLLPAPIATPKPLLAKKTVKTLDLHGATQAQAHALVLRFLEQAQLESIGTVRIITGKGKSKGVGVLQTQLPRWLEETALRAFIISYDTAAPQQGGDGVW